MRKACVLLTAALFTSVGCGSGTSVPVPIGALDLAGQYGGSATDTTFGNATASTTLAERGSTLSGTVKLVSTTSGATLLQTVSWTVGASYTVTGTTTSAGGSCTFSSTGTYDATTNVLSGTYSAVSGCSGERGTFSLLQQCTNPAIAARKRLTRPTSC